MKRNSPLLARWKATAAVAGPGLGGLAATGIAALATAVMRAAIPFDYYWAAVGFWACLGALSLVRLVTDLAGGRPVAAPVTTWQAKPDTRQFLSAFVYGDGIPALEAAALEEAAALYGPGARLEVLRMGGIDTSCLSGKGRFCTHVLVRCLDFPEEVA